MNTTARPQYPTLSLCIDGQFLRGDDRRIEQVFDPATEDVLGELSHARPRDIEAALVAAERGFAQWRKVGALERSDKLRRVASLIRERNRHLAALITLELGKPFAQALAEANTAAEMFEWAAEETRRNYGRTIPPRVPGMRLTVEHVPLGPVAGFSGWNAPLLTPSRKISSALAAGCSIVMKPSEATPAAALALIQCVLDADIPSAAVSMVFGDPAQISQLLLSSPIVRVVTFTGSIPVGKQLASLAAQGMKRTIMELGGHAPAIVCDDVDVATVVAAAVTAKFRSAGQVCTSPTRFFVQRRVYEEFIAQFAAATSALTIGNGFDPATRMGPLASRRRVEVMESMVADAVKHGATIVTGGKRIGDRGYFFQPTVLRDVPSACLPMREEPFGPLALIAAFDDCDEAIERANALPLGLAGYVWTRNTQRAALFRELLDVGTFACNHFTASWAETPFGGMRESGLSSEGGIEGVRAFQQVKFISEA